MVREISVEEAEELQKHRNEDDINYFIEFLLNSSKYNQIVVMYNDKTCKVLRENYYPKDGLVVFKHLNDWSVDGFSAYEMTEFLLKYRDIIHKIQFEAHDGTPQDFVNVYESEFFSDYGNYSSVVVVGDGSGTLKFYGKVSDNSINWASDTLYGNYRKSFNR